MVSDQSDHGPEPTPQEVVDSGSRSPQEAVDYEALVQKHQDALRLIAALEAQIDAMTRLLAAGADRVTDSSGSGSQGRIPDSAGLAERIEALEHRAFVARIDALEDQTTASPEIVRQLRSETTSTSPGREERLARQNRDPNVAQLRLQVTSLANQLAQSEERAREIHAGRTRRRSHSRRDGRGPRFLRKLREKWQRR